MAKMPCESPLMQMENLQKSKRDYNVPLCSYLENMEKELKFSRN